MLRKLASVLAVAFAVTLTFASAATAAPYDPATIGATRGAGGSISILGTGFGTNEPDDYVTVTVVVNGVSTSYQVDLDDDGNFTTGIPGIGDDEALVTIVGNRSGETRTAHVAGVNRTADPTSTTTAAVTTTVQVPTTVAVPTTVDGVPSTAYVPSTVTSVAVIGGSGGSADGSDSGSSGGGYYSSDNGTGSSGGSYYSAGGDGSSAGSGSAQGAYGSGYAATGAYGSGLANTGASIAGPMAIGVGTLTVGLGLLFFGTRGVIRRKGAKPGVN